MAKDHDIQSAAYGQKCVTCGKTQEDGRHGDVTGGHDFIASAARKRGRLIDVYRQLRSEYDFGRFAALIELLDWL